MRALGLPNEWAIGEVFGFDEDLLTFIPQPVVGIIVAVERLNPAEDKALGDVANVDNDTVPFYMKQTGALDNACGIIACLHAIYNNPTSIQLGEGSVLH